MPRSASGIFDIPEHRAHKAAHTQKTRLNPDLQIEVVGVDKGGLVMIEVELPDVLLRGGGTEARAGQGRALNDLNGRPVKGHPAGGGGIRRVGDGEDAVEHCGRQKRHCQHTQKYEHRHGAGKTHPRRTGIRHSHGHASHAENTGGDDLPLPVLRRNDQRQHQRQQQQQDLREGIRVIENRVDPPRHSGVDLQIHIGGVHLHALKPLDDAVGSGTAYADRRPGAQALQVLPIPHSADGDERQQRGGHMVDKEAGGKPRRVGKYHRQRHGCQQQHRVDAHPVHLQPPPGPHSPGVKQQQQQNACQKAIGVVPALVGNTPQRRDAPELSDRGVVPHIKGKAGKKAVLKCQIPRLVPCMEQRSREIDKNAQKPAQQALPPRPGHRALPAQEPQHAAILNLFAAPAANCR